MLRWVLLQQIMDSKGNVVAQLRCNLVFEASLFHASHILDAPVPYFRTRISLVCQQCNHNGLSHRLS